MSRYISTRKDVELWRIVCLLLLQTYFLARVLAKALKMLFCFFDLFSQISHFFHIFNFWWNNHLNISLDFKFFYQIESDLSKMDQNGSNLIKLDFWWNNHWNILSDFQLYLFFDQIESDLSKMDQNGSNLIKLDFWWNNHWNISLDF